MNSPYLYEQIVRHRYEEMRRHELHAQHVAHERAAQEPSLPRRGLSWRRLPRLRLALS